MPEYSDEELVAGFQQNNFNDFEALVHRYSSRLYKLIYRIIRDESEAQDLVQETFLRVYQNIQRYNPQYPFKTWIYSIASHLAINVLHSAERKRVLFFWNRDKGGDRSQEEIPLHEEQIIDLSQNPEETLIYQENLNMINKAIESLKPSQKIAFILNKIEGLSYKEVAQVMELSLSAVETLIFRAKQSLYHQLKSVR